MVVLANDIKAVNHFVAEGSNNMLMSNATDGSLVECDLDYIEYVLHRTLQECF